MTAMYLAGLVARDMTAFHTVWKEVNLVDPHFDWGREICRF